MIVEAQITIDAERAAIWAAMANIESAADIIRGVERIEIVERPAHGLVGLRWKETRILFGDPATVEKTITAAVDHESYTTRAESDGFVFFTTMTIKGEGPCFTLISAHDSQPQNMVAKLKAIPMMLFFRGVIRKAILEDLSDIKLAAEGKSSRA